MANHLREGLVLATWASDDLGVDLECWFEYTPAERGAREYGSGVQLEPDYPETWTLCHVYLPGSEVDIAPIMDDKLIAMIEEDAASGGAPESDWEF